MSFGTRLRSAMDAAGLTQPELAAKLGVSKARAGELARREAPPRTETTIRLAGALGCEPSALDPRLAGVPLPEPGSRTHKAAEILARKFHFRVEYVPTSRGHYMICRRKGEDEPAAFVSGPNTGRHILDAPGLIWGCIAPNKLQRAILAALNGHA